MRSLRLYVAGKVSANSSFGTHYWRDEFCSRLSSLSGLNVINLDPTKNGVQDRSPHIIFGADAYMIKGCDALLVYLSDDISVGGSQEILIAKYFNKPVIGLAPLGGKFNGGRKEHFGHVIEAYKDPFVFSTCDYVFGTIEEAARGLKDIHKKPPKGIRLIDECIEEYLSIAS